MENKRIKCMEHRLGKSCHIRQGLSQNLHRFRRRNAQRPRTRGRQRHHNHAVPIVRVGHHDLHGARRQQRRRNHHRPDGERQQRDLRGSEQLRHRAHRLEHRHRRLPSRALSGREHHQGGSDGRGRLHRDLHGHGHAGNGSDTDLRGARQQHWADLSGLRHQRSRLRAGFYNGKRHCWLHPRRDRHRIQR